jgi:hypothetical protein
MTILVMTKYNKGEGPLTAEAIRNGEGTNSIADFLHADTAAKMLDKATVNNDDEQNRIAAQRVGDTAANRYPESLADQLKDIKQNSSGIVREQAETNARQRFQDKQNAIAEVSLAIEEEYAEKMEVSNFGSPFTYENIPPKDQQLLTVGAKDRLRLRSKRVLAGKQFADVTIIKEQPPDPDTGLMMRGSLETWMGLSDAAKREENLDSPYWSEVFAQPEMMAAKIEQAELIKMANTPFLNPAMKPKDMITQAFRESEFMPANGRDIEQQGIAARLEIRFKAAILKRANEKVPPSELTSKEMNEELVKLLEPMAYTDTDTFWFDSDYDEDEKVRVAEMTPEVLEKAFLDSDRAKQSYYTGRELDDFAERTGSPITEHQWLLQKASEAANKKGKGEGWKPSRYDLDRAYFALKNNLGTAEVERRLLGE